MRGHFVLLAALVGLLPALPACRSRDCEKHTLDPSVEVSFAGAFSSSVDKVVVTAEVWQEDTLLQSSTRELAKGSDELDTFKQQGKLALHFTEEEARKIGASEIALTFDVYVGTTVSRFTTGRHPLVQNWCNFWEASPTGTPPSDGGPPHDGPPNDGPPESDGPPSTTQRELSTVADALDPEPGTPVTGAVLCDFDGDGELDLAAAMPTFDPTGASAGKPSAGRVSIWYDITNNLAGRAAQPDLTITGAISGAELGRRIECLSLSGLLDVLTMGASKSVYMLYPLPPKTLKAIDLASTSQKMLRLGNQAQDEGLGTSIVTSLLDVGLSNGTNRVYFVHAVDLQNAANNGADGIVDFDLDTQAAWIEDPTGQAFGVSLAGGLKDNVGKLGWAIGNDLDKDKLGTVSLVWDVPTTPGQSTQLGSLRGWTLLGKKGTSDPAPRVGSALVSGVYTNSGDVDLIVAAVGADRVYGIAASEIAKHVVADPTATQLVIDDTAKMTLQGTNGSQFGKSLALRQVGVSVTNRHELLVGASYAGGGNGAIYWLRNTAGWSTAALNQQTQVLFQGIPGASMGAGSQLQVPVFKGGPPGAFAAAADGKAFVVPF